MDRAWGVEVDLFSLPAHERACSRRGSALPVLGWKCTRIGVATVGRRMAPGVLADVAVRGSAGVERLEG